MRTEGNKGLRVAVTGAGGFIGSHLVQRLSDRGHRVVGIDVKPPEFGRTAADEFMLVDLRKPVDSSVFAWCEEVYALAADMGGMGYIGTHGAAILKNSLLINLGTIEEQ